jgi:hypothetical protein
MVSDSTSSVFAQLVSIRVSPRLLGRSAENRFPNSLVRILQYLVVVRMFLMSITRPPATFNAHQSPHEYPPPSGSSCACSRCSWYSSPRHHESSTRSDLPRPLAQHGSGRSNLCPQPACRCSAHASDQACRPMPPGFHSRCHCRYLSFRCGRCPLVSKRVFSEDAWGRCC